MRKLKKNILIIFLISLVYLALAKLIEPMITGKLVDHHVYYVFVFACYGWSAGGVAYYFLKKEGYKISIIKTSFKGMMLSLAVSIVLTLVTILISCGFAKSSLRQYEQIANNGMYAIFQSSMANMIFHSGVVLVAAIIASLTINFVFILGEQLFLSGYLWDKLSCLGFMRASLWIGVIGSVWKAPSLLLFSHHLPNYPIMSSLMMCGLNALMMPLCLYFRLVGKSLAPAVFFHGMVSAYASFSSLFFPEADLMLVGGLGVAGIMSLILVNVVMLPLYKKVSSPVTLRDQLLESS